MNRYDYGLTLSQEWIVLSNMGIATVSITNVLSAPPLYHDLSYLPEIPWTQKLITQATPENLFKCNPIMS